VGCERFVLCVRVAEDVGCTLGPAAADNVVGCFCRTGWRKTQNVWVGEKWDFLDWQCDGWPGGALGYCLGEEFDEDKDKVSTEMGGM
jgi:hypothetical protein